MGRVPKRIPYRQFLPACPAPGLLSTYIPGNFFLIGDPTNPVKLILKVKAVWILFHLICIKD